VISGDEPRHHFVESAYFEIDRSVITVARGPETADLDLRLVNDIVEPEAVSRESRRLSDS
jgi:hypothetical protein